MIMGPVCLVYHTLKLKQAMKFLFEEEITEEDRVSLFGWSDRVFPAEGDKYLWAVPTNRIVARELGIAVAHLGFASFQLETKNENIKIIGVGGVVVRPEFQGQNIPKTMFSMLHNSNILDSKNSASSLFCPQRLTSYYAKYGYKVFKGSVKFLQKNEYVEAKEFIFMLRGAGELTGAINIPSEPW